MKTHRTLFPAIEPYESGRLKVSSIHELYWEQSGNPNGQPVVFLHGGPGAGTSPDHRRFFDPQLYRIILFDQRGAGRSTPHAELRENTTWDLVKDIETLRHLLKIEKWVVFGGSWGSTLALAYSTSHPDAVKALILRGIFLCRPIDIQWFYQEGAGYIYPDAWENYLEPIPHDERGNLVEAYYKRLTSPDQKIRMQAAKAWSVWEAQTSKLIPDPVFVDKFAQPDFALAFARIECHFFSNKVWFSTPNYLIEQVGKIRHIPAAIVHGRYDVVCPIDNAYQLKKAWPEAHFTIVADAGHNVFEPGIVSELIKWTETFKN